ncbi:dihydrodipicolinate synthase family protein [Nakamurella endophytica]|uniref:Dihydrodipicolinate synthase family protein n=1 Tax=Nakamurella endophytica TaxID=1748367 RepID=A0A917SV01_9ACTN|nr:dihydrodipicolinate synthase family protein [Nakamurella endophytica]GGL97502.1 hypothetical protein GCM10011594_16670 [Nakamurella endophytica]
MTSIALPTADGGWSELELRDPVRWSRPAAPLRSRVAYAAVHVVPDRWSDTTPGAPAEIDWDTTMALRRGIWEYGLGVADAMDTAQRGMGLDWPAARELIRRSGIEARNVGGALACGAGTDQLSPAGLPTGRAGLQRIVDAYREQVDVIRDAGATVVLMASRALAATARTPGDFADVYGTLLAEQDSPVILHWLGPMFDPALAGYWGSTDVDAATDAFLAVVVAHAEKIDGVKVSLLDADLERSLRARLPHAVRLYTGDDFNYPELVVGDGGGHSDALLGAFAAIYPAASGALQALDAGDAAAARAILESTRDLSRHLFATPTMYYKTGIAFASWLDGRQPAFLMAGGLHGARPMRHLITAFRLLDQAGLLSDPDRAAHRMRTLLATAGWER